MVVKMLEDNPSAPIYFTKIYLYMKRY
uniref:Uncharacterized protein n=1 Tax=Arundo donax TaxID=35708 RepID=A0A0A9BC89_ARUDO